MVVNVYFDKRSSHRKVDRPEIIKPSENPERTLVFYAKVKTRDLKWLLMFTSIKDPPIVMLTDLK